MTIGYFFHHCYILNRTLKWQDPGRTAEHTHLVQQVEPRDVGPLCLQELSSDLVQLLFIGLLKHRRESCGCGMIWGNAYSMYIDYVPITRGDLKGLSPKNNGQRQFKDRLDNWEYSEEEVELWGHAHSVIQLSLPHCPHVYDSHAALGSRQGCDSHGILDDGKWPAK